MTFRLPRFPVPILMAFMTSGATPALSMSDRSDTGAFEGRIHSRMVAPGRETDLSGGQNDTDHRRRRWEQRLGGCVLWKFELQKWRRRNGPPCFGLSFPTRHHANVNKIEHRLFSFIPRTGAANLDGTTKRLFQLIAKTTTAKGLKVTCRLDRRKYPTGRKVSNEEMKRIHPRPNQFHGHGTMCHLN